MSTVEIKSEIPAELACVIHTSHLPAAQRCTYDNTKNTGVFVSVGAGYGITVDEVRATGANCVQLHAPNNLQDPEAVGQLKAAIRTLIDSGITIGALVGGAPEDDWSSIANVHKTVGLAPEAYRKERLAYYKLLVDIAAECGIKHQMQINVNGHLGSFGALKDEDRRDFIDAVRNLCEYCEVANVKFDVETGPETADELLGLLAEVNHPALGINFDAANMVLYGSGDPLEAFRKLLPCVSAIHLKGAEVTGGTPGVDWGKEVNPFSGHEKSKKILEDLLRAGGIAKGGRPIQVFVEREIPGESPDQKLQGMSLSLREMREIMGELTVKINEENNVDFSQLVFSSMA